VAAAIAARLRRQEFTVTTKDTDFVSLLSPDGRAGSCEDFTGLYLVLAERLGIRATPVVAPMHVFPRLQRGGQRLNVETMADGKAYSDSVYAERLGINEDSIESGVYLADRPVKSMLAAALSNRASRLVPMLPTLRGEEARRACTTIDADLKVSMLIDDTLPNTHHNAAVFQSIIGDGRALQSFQKTLALDPHNISAHLGLGLLHEREGRGELAQQAYASGLSVAEMLSARIGDERLRRFLVDPGEVAQLRKLSRR